MAMINPPSLFDLWRDKQQNDFFKGDLIVMINIISIFFTIFAISVIESLFMCAVFYLLKKVQKKVGNKFFALISTLLLVTVCMFTTPFVALLILIFFILLAVIYIISSQDIITKLVMLTVYFFIFQALLPMMGNSCSKESAQRIKCISNLKQISVALYMYAEDNNGHFPDKDGYAGFKMLIEQNYLSDQAVYHCPATTDSESEQFKSSYIYYGGLTTSSPENTILVQDRAGNHMGYNNYLYCGMNVKGICDPNYIKDPNYHDPDKDPIIKRLVRLTGWR